MALHWPTFFTRLGSAIVFSAIMMAGLLWNEYAFIGLICLIQVLCLKEFFPLMKKIAPGVYFPKWLPMGIQVLSFRWVIMQTSVFFGIRFTPVLIAVPILIILATTLSKKTALHAGALALAGQMYIMV